VTVLYMCFVILALLSLRDCTSTQQLTSAAGPSTRHSTALSTSANTPETTGARVIACYVTLTMLSTFRLCTAQRQSRGRAVRVRVRARVCVTCRCGMCCACVISSRRHHAHRHELDAECAPDVDQPHVARGAAAGARRGCERFESSC
jgi:hypothetical protein